ncbi:unnamed protein product [Mycena citricolor]|uniref:Uncharacterized protein n=1 Tax=Mycena citricolor TaxID=2018698 RepID=A0AAD2K411_9AGAR|nr:unnamed protein product [Mycena citricolor]
MSDEAKSQQIFQRLKPICVPLLGASHLSTSSIPDVSRRLTELLDVLKSTRHSSPDLVLSNSLLSYTFYPLSTLLSRNPLEQIPNGVLEKILHLLTILYEDWWWSCEVKLWEQLFVFCAGVIADMKMPTEKGKGKGRDDETKCAAVQCMSSLIRPRTTEEATRHGADAPARLGELRTHASAQRFIPILGQTLDSLLTTASSRSPALQQWSLEVLDILICHYFPAHLTPSVLPGVVSTTTKLALGAHENVGWAKGATVAASLKVMEAVIVQSIGDDVCIREGAVIAVEDLGDLTELMNTQTSRAPSDDSKRPYATVRSPSWLQGTSSQLHIALNTLKPLVVHENPVALQAVIAFSSGVLQATVLTLHQSQELLLSFLLSLSIQPLPAVSVKARASLLDLLTVRSRAQQPLLQALMHSTRDNLTALPRLLLSQADSKVQHVAGLIEGVCALGESLSVVSSGLATLLGPTGGIERWGWRLLSVMELAEPPRIFSRTSAAQLMLENDPDGDGDPAFPELTLRNLSTRAAYESLVRMWQCLGRAAGDSCLYAVEWFIEIGRNGVGIQAVAALWCASRLLEGVANISLFSGTHSLGEHRSARLQKLARSVGKLLAELWDQTTEPTSPPLQSETVDEDLTVQLVKGLDPVEESLKIFDSRNLPPASRAQGTLHEILSLQLLAITSGILQSRSTSLLLYTLYPVLHSLVSPDFHLSSTALAALNFMARHASYASPGNLLLSNFDYALDAVSRRLTRRWLDIRATRVLVVLIRLVGPEVVDRAGDVVEECFDRLDEFHGYDVVVEGLVEVLGEVIRVIQTEEELSRAHLPPRPVSPSLQIPSDDAQLESLFAWFSTRSQEDPVREEESPASGDPSEEPKASPAQALTQQIVSRSVYFLTHGSPVIRARILNLLGSSASVLADSSLLPSIHTAWPFIMNRLNDKETFVVAAAASLIEGLVLQTGSFMYRRIWNDVWPRFRTLLAQLDKADRSNALSRPTQAGGTAYAHSHRLYRAMLRSMTATVKSIRAQDESIWQAVLAFRRFLHSHAHDELQRCAREFYLATSQSNADLVWLALSMSLPTATDAKMAFLRQPMWDIQENVALILK